VVARVLADIERDGGSFLARFASLRDINQE
jgi:hypothetical protein